MGSILMKIFNVIRSIAMFKNVMNAAVFIWWLERPFDFIIGPFLWLFFKIDYEKAAWMERFRWGYSQLFANNIFRAGFIDIVIKNDDKERELEKNKPFVWLFTHASNFDPFVLVGNLPVRGQFVAKMI